MHTHLCKLVIVITTCLIMSACASHSQKFSAVEKHLVEHHAGLALKELDRHYGNSGSDIVLYYLNKGLILRMNKEYKKSNQALEKAKKFIDELETLSLSEQTTSLTINDATLSFTGERYEKILLFSYKALNYINLGKLDEARVEILQQDVKFRELLDDNQKPILSEDGFPHYFSGLIYEANQEWSNALIAYRQAYEAYNQSTAKVPEQLKTSLLRLTEHLGLFEELENYKKTFGISTWTTQRDSDELGELVFIFHNGLAPVKYGVAAHTLNPQTGQMIRIATPAYRPRPSMIKKAKIKINNNYYTLEIVEDIHSIAIKTLESQSAEIVARALARAVLKYNASRQVGKNDEALGLLINLAGVVTEQADTRSWSTLPYDIQMARVALQPGKYDLTIELIGNHGRIINKHAFSDVTITKRQKTFLSYRWIPLYTNK